MSTKIRRIGYSKREPDWEALQNGTFQGEFDGMQGLAGLEEGEEVVGAGCGAGWVWLYQYRGEFCVSA